MRLLVTEYVCGGGWSAGPRPESLLREGRAMLEAIVRDVASLGDTQVLTTWDATLGPAPFADHPGIRIVTAASPDEERDRLSDLAGQADLALVIAPEFDGILAERCRGLREQGVPLLNPSAAALELCADKLELARRLQTCGVPTIPTEPIGPRFLGPQCVVKLRDGAGSTDMALLTSPEEFSDWRRTHPCERFVMQPHLSGRAVSAAALFRRGDMDALLPIAEQLLSPDGRFRYEGGIVPAPNLADPLSREVVELIRAAGEAVPGLHGYVGFDLLLTGPQRDRPILVEINPRPTTSWIGYRRLFAGELAAAVMELHRPVKGGESLTRFSKVPTNPVRFLPDGTDPEKATT